MKTGPQNQKREMKAAVRSSRGERGYALVGMIGVMLFALILTTATAPSIKLEAQREKEEEMLWRGQQIQAALARYGSAGPGGQVGQPGQPGQGTPGNPGRLPTDLKELVDGVNIGLKKVHLLRPSALCDPMTPCDPGSTNWKLVHPGDPLIRELYEAYVALQQKGAILPNLPVDMQMLAQQATVQIMGQGSDGNGTGSQDSGSDSDSALGKSPIVGVVSRFNGEMFRNYFGMDSYQSTLFYKGLEVYASGFNAGTRVVLGNEATNNPAIPNNSPNCGPNQTYLGGRCLNMIPVKGRECHGPDGTTVPCSQ
jgi:hypothetical protein